MPRSSSPTVLTLYDLSGSLIDNNEFRDDEGNLAYYYQIHKRNPLSAKITRLPDWGPCNLANGVPGLANCPYQEPWTAWLYFTSNERVEGYLKFGKDEPVPMIDHLMQKSRSSSSRYFNGLDSQVYEWRPASRSFECYNLNERLIAVYEYSLEKTEHAKLEIKLGAEHMATEIVATLLLNRHALHRS